MNKKYFFLIVLIIFFALSCEPVNNENPKIKKNIKPAADKDNNLVYSKYKIPLPIEIFSFLEKYSKFNGNYLNKTTNKNHYIKELDRAINLGIYTTDLVYCNKFFESDLSIQYFETAKDLANSIGIYTGYTPEFVQRLQENSTNKDSIIKIVEESYSKACNDLHKNEKNNILPFVVFGNWIEGVYIIIQSKESVPAERIKEQVLKQKTGLQNVINYILDVQIETSAFYYSDDLSIIMEQLKYIIQLYE